MSHHAPHMNMPFSSSSSSSSCLFLFFFFSSFLRLFFLSFLFSSSWPVLEASPSQPIINQIVALLLLQRREGAAEGGEEDHADHRLRTAPGDVHHVRRQEVRLQDRLRRQGLGRLDILPAY